MDKIFNKPFAVNGARVTIPENGTENERVSFDKGFTQPYEVEAPSVDNPSGQGFNILRPEMNEILNQLSNACNFLAENIDKWTALTTENLNDIKQTGRYYQKLNINATSERNYPTNVAGYLIVVSDGNINNYGVTQIYKQWNSEKVYIRRTTNATAWSNWDSFVLTSEFNNKITSLQNTDTNLSNNKEDKTRISTQDLDDENLNNMNISGFYRQTASAKATTALNYPTTEAGTLIVLIPSGSGSTYLTQIYIVKDGNGIFTRARKNNSSWTDWEKLALKSEVDLKRNISDSYSKSEVYTKAQCNSAFRTIADSYSKSEVNNRTPQLQYSRVNYSLNNIRTATFTIPNSTFITYCCVIISFRIFQKRANNITFNFKIGNNIVATKTFKRYSDSGQDYDVGDYMMSMTNFPIADYRGQTVTPEITMTETGGLLELAEICLSIQYQ